MVSVGGFDLRSPASDAGTFAGLSYTLLKNGLGGRTRTDGLRLPRPAL